MTTTATGAAIKRNQSYLTVGCPGIGGFPAVSPERVKVLRPGYAPDYFVVRFDDGGKVCMHASRLADRVPA